MQSTRNQTENLMSDLRPSFLSTLMLWFMLFWPAMMMYSALHVYSKLDEFRHVGFFSKRPIPAPAKMVDPLTLPHASPAAGPSE